MPMSPAGLDLDKGRGASGKPKKGETVVNDFSVNSMGVMSETVSERRDRMRQAVCAKESAWFESVLRV
ncbi:hypothetical protein OE88DRAFT_1733990 [Heliocybe sulcata]|uniref:Uncharacterized protein n=1 Tax=Heliocybe sulcata TaxID=5364 RepID=A0A5C3N5F6_9AGAM|nr:hypothetical protein OE88DRAFT_1733990 [Heliocybe sulcata]